VGGLRYLYRPANLNVENAPTNATVALPGTSEGILGTSPSNPWLPPAGTTNQVGGTNVAITTNIVGTALRVGVDKLNFLRVDFDSATGLWVPMTNVWNDTYITNGVSGTQTLQRALPRPDVLFSAADLGIAAGAPAVYPITMTLSGTSYQNNDGLNGLTALDGPGVIAPPIDFSFSKLGRPYINFSPDLGEDLAVLSLWWGSFDGTTNLPVVYPSGTSIQDLEGEVFSGAADAGQNPWLAPPGTTTTQSGGTTGGTGGGVGGGTVP
jgi:hypothetical protein